VTDKEKNKQNKSSVFELDEKPSYQEKQKMGKTFILEESESIEMPKSISADEVLQSDSAFSGLRLEALPLKGIKILCYSLALLVLSMVGWEIFNFYLAAKEAHWVLAGMWVGFVGFIFLLASYVLGQFLRDKKNLSVFNDMQKHAARLIMGADFGKGSIFIEELKAVYSDKPQALHLKNCLDDLPDYNNDKEIINYIDNVFLGPLDAEALSRIASSSRDNIIAVAMSPWASVDMLFMLWRNIKLVDEISQIYGIRPSLPVRIQLVKSVIAQLLIIGAIEVVLEEVTEAGLTSVASIASAKVGQGLGAGRYTMKIGIAAMKVCRPVEFSDNTMPKMSAIFSNIVEQAVSFIKKALD
jgi:putative membrane protein